MKRLRLAIALVACGIFASACSSPPQPNAATTAAAQTVDPDITAFIAKIRAVDNHSHVNTVAPDDPDSDALPVDSLLPIELPVTLLPTNPAWLAAYKALYKYPHDDMSEPHLADLRKAKQDILRSQGDNFPTWALDQAGTEILLANRVAMGPGLPTPRFRWVSFADALLLPLSNRAEAAISPDREKLYPLEDKLLQRYLSDLHMATPPATLDGYLKTVVTPTLEAQKQRGCVAVKFEAAYLRPLNFDDVPGAAASAIYAKYAGGGEPSHADYKALQDFLFRYIAREAGRLGMAVHIHSFEGAGNYFQTAGADPLLLEPTLNDPAMRK